MTGERECYSEAQRFCLEDYHWIVETAERESQKRGLGDRANDIAQDVCRDVGKIKDDDWAEKRDKRSYVARAIINRANDLYNEDSGLQSLSDNILTSTPLEAMHAAIMLRELYAKLEVHEQEHLKLYFDGCTCVEIADALGITPAAARKRTSRLLMRLGELSKDNKIPATNQPGSSPSANP